MAQPVSDKAVIPMAVTFNQILRLHVIDGGNIEFVFNTIDQYNFGVPNSAFYTSSVVIASSTKWQLHFGAETPLMMPTDNAANPGIPIDNIGFLIGWTGNHLCCFPGDDVMMGAAYSDADAVQNGLKLFTGTAADLLFTDGGGGTSGGDVTDNAFTILWECGTQIGGSVSSPMNALSMLAQSPVPDRYVDNAFLDLEAL